MNSTTPPPTSAIMCAADKLSTHNSANIFIIPAAIVGALIMALNLLVVVAVIKNKKLHKPAFCYVSSLAVADFIAGLMLVFSFFREFFTGKTSRLELELKQGIFIMSVSASILTLLVISLNRYFVIVHPFHYRAKMNNFIVVLAIAAIWVYSIIGGVLPIAGWNATNYDCSEIIPGLARNYVFVVGLHVVVILIVILVLYLLIFWKVRQNARSFKVAGGRSSEDNAHLKVAKTLFIVTAAFAVCWMPYMIICILDFSHSIKLEKYTPFFAILAVLNSCLNPLIYAWRDVEMRNTFKSILCPCPCCNRHEQDPGMESSNASTQSTIFPFCHKTPEGVDGAYGSYEDKTPPKDSLEHKHLVGPIDTS